MANRRRAAGSAVVALALASATAGLTGCAGSSSSSTGASATVAPNGAVGVGRAAVGPTPGRTAAPHAGELQAVAVRLPSAVIKTAAVRLRVAHDRIQATVTRIAGVP